MTEPLCLSLWSIDLFTATHTVINNETFEDKSDKFNIFLIVIKSHDQTVSPSLNTFLLPVCQLIGSYWTSLKFLTNKYSQ